MIWVFWSLPRLISAQVVIMISVDTTAMAIGITSRHIPTTAIAPILLHFATAPAMSRRLALSDVVAAGRWRERPLAFLALSFAL